MSPMVPACLHCGGAMEHQAGNVYPSCSECLRKAEYPPPGDPLWTEPDPAKRHELRQTAWQIHRRTLRRETWKDRAATVLAALAILAVLVGLSYLIRGAW